MRSVGTEAFNGALTMRSGWRGSLQRHWPLVAVLSVAMIYMVTVTLLHTQAVSPIDEPQYIDYLDKVYRQGMVHKGEYLGALVRELFACHGVIPFGQMGPACGTDLSDPAAFPYGGVSSAPIYPPVQFWFARVVGDVFGLIPGVGQLAGWRLVGTLWMAAGLTFSYLIARRLRVADWRFVAVALAFVVSPYGYWTFSFVSTDAPIFCYGAIVLWISMLVVRRERSGWWLVALGAIGPLFKATSLVAVGFAFLYVLTHRIIEVRGTGGARAVLRTPCVWHGLGAVVANVAVAAAWTKLIPLLAVSGAEAEQGVSSPFSIDLFGQQFAGFLSGVPQWVVPETDNVAIFLPLGWLAIAGVVGSLLLLPYASRDRALTIALFAAYLIGAPVLVLSVVAATGLYFPIPPRYGIALVPALIIVTIPLLRNRWALRALVVYVAVLAVYQLALTIALARWFA